MEYGLIISVALGSAIGYALGMVSAFLIYRNSLNNMKSQWADKATVANLLRNHVSRNEKSKSKKKYYNRKNNRSKSGGKKL